MSHRYTLLIVIFVAALSWTTREINHQKIPVPARDTWITSDKDTLYHLRRVERAFDEGLAGRDPYLAYPEGSAIPWPPYYTAIAWAWTAPGAPAEPAARCDWIERRVASLPRVFGVATSVLAALGGTALAGPVAGLAAGTSYALSSASLVTSRVGNGDHHAFVALLAAAMLLLMSRALRTTALAEPRGSAARGAAVGAICGLALGSWVASLLYVLILQLALGWLVVRHASRPIPGLPAFGLALHGAAILVLLPAVIASPWNGDQPWSVVNLTWFHPFWLFLGGLVFLPLRRVRGKLFLRAYPAIVAGGLAALALLLFRTDFGPAAGIREGFAWASGQDVFMSIVGESRGLIGIGSYNPVAVLGAGLFVLPIAWLAATGLAFFKDRFEMLPWAVALPLLAVQSARQSRFADVLAMPMAVIVAWALVAVWKAGPLAPVRARAERLGSAGAAVGAALLLAATLLAHGGIVRHTWSALGRDPQAPGVPVPPADVVVRELAEWIRANTPEPADYAVLAPWTWGHLLEWVADRPTVATNFGPFVGEDSFRDPARFFMEENPREAEALLERRRARYVLVTSWLPDQVKHLIRAVDPTRRIRSRYIDLETGGLGLLPAWYQTLGARLLFDGHALRADGQAEAPLDFLRLVRASPQRDPRYQTRPQPMPMGMIWERVPGARLEGQGAPGDTLHVALAVRYRASRYELTWSGAAVADDDGLARLRVPYATEGANGDGIASAPASWRFGGRQGQVAIPEQAVLESGAVALEGPARLL